MCVHCYAHLVDATNALGSPMQHQQHILAPNLTGIDGADH